MCECACGVAWQNVSPPAPPVVTRLCKVRSFLAFWSFCVCAFLKILTLEERGDQGIESQEERQGKMLLHTEYSLLSLLHTQDGVVHHHGLFQVSGRGGCLSPPFPRAPSPAGLRGPPVWLEQLARAAAWEPCQPGAPGLPGWGGREARLRPR